MNNRDLVRSYDLGVEKTTVLRVGKEVKVDGEMIFHPVCAAGHAA